MEIRLRPGLADLVKKDVERGSYASIDDYVEQALTMLHEQEAWLAANRSEVSAKIEEGYFAAQRGELLDPDQVKSRLAELKRTRSSKRD
jgi:Arc/MetJ-type ribon-helix-helix transcriptional regulator